MSCWILPIDVSWLSSVTPSCPNSSEYWSSCWRPSIIAEQLILLCLASASLLWRDTRSWNVAVSLPAASAHFAARKSRSFSSPSNAVNNQGKIPRSRCSVGMATCVRTTGRILGRMTLLYRFAWLMDTWALHFDQKTALLLDRIVLCRQAWLSVLIPQH